MTLSQQELDIISLHANNQPLLASYIVDQEWDSIASYYASKPTTFDEPNNNRVILMGLMPFEDEARFYRLKRFRDWYANLAERIHLGTNVNPIIISSLKSINNVEIQSYAKKTIISVNAHHASNDEFPIIVEKMFARTAGGNIKTKEAILAMLICLLTDGTFSSNLGLIYYPEINLEERYKSLGLSEAPTTDEVEQALT